MNHPNTRPDMGQLPDAHNCQMLADMNRDRQTPSGWWIIPAAVLGGMIIAALVFLAYSNAYARGIDAVNNPHLEGFE
tara:strand:+ start:983 stop:1213 length:231 start_codon:yes stop_codon:yes gene_type:complete